MASGRLAMQLRSVARITTVTTSTPTPAMAEAIEREKMYDAEEARCNYLAAVEKAVKGA